QLALHRDALLRREQLELALLLQPAQVVQAADPVRDRAPVREQSAEPSVCDVRHADALRLLLDRVLGLLLRADEHDDAVPRREIADELVRLLEALERLLQIDDVDAAALGEDEALHLRIPAAGLMTEVDSGLQELLHGDDGHLLLPSSGCHASRRPPPEGNSPHPALTTLRVLPPGRVR